MAVSAATTTEEADRNDHGDAEAEASGFEIGLYVHDYLQKANAPRERPVMPSVSAR